MSKLSDFFKAGLKNPIAKKTLGVLSFLGIASVAFTSEVMAGTGGAEFGDIYTMLVGWTQGTLGKIRILAIFIVVLALFISYPIGSSYKCNSRRFFKDWWEPLGNLFAKHGNQKK